MNVVLRGSLRSAQPYIQGTVHKHQNWRHELVCYQTIMVNDIFWYDMRVQFNNQIKANQDFPEKNKINSTDNKLQAKEWCSRPYFSGNCCCRIFITVFRHTHCTREIKRRRRHKFMHKFTETNMVQIFYLHNVLLVQKV